MTLGWFFYGHHDIIKSAQAGVKSAPLRWLCGIQEIMRIFSWPLTEKRRLPRKPTYQASNQAAFQGGCVNGLTPLGDGNELLTFSYDRDTAGSVNGLTPLGDGNIKQFRDMLRSYR